MKKHKIVVTLSKSGINNAIKQLEKYRQELAQKESKLRERVAERLIAEINKNFADVIADDLTAQSGGARTASARAEKAENGDTMIVYVKDEDVVWCEFGAGVYHNGSAGSSPNPYGNKLGFLIGTYGHGQGKKEIWCFKDADGEKKFTHGTPASMPMYRAVQAVIPEIPKIAQEVFGND